MCLENTSPHSLGDDQCVDVMNKKLIIEVGKFFQQSDR